jgi:hypothetical protein
MTAPTITPDTPRLGEMGVIGRTLTCVTAVLGLVGTVWWVQTAQAPYTALTGVMSDTGLARVWAGRAYVAG